MNGRERAIRSKLLAWADNLDLPVTERQLTALAITLGAAVEHVERWRPTAAPTRKPGTGPDDARRIAARLEATYQEQQP